MFLKNLGREAVWGLLVRFFFFNTDLGFYNKLSILAVMFLFCDVLRFFSPKALASQCVNTLNRSMVVV